MTYLVRHDDGPESQRHLRLPSILKIKSQTLMDYLQPLISQEIPAAPLPSVASFSRSATTVADTSHGYCQQMTNLRRVMASWCMLNFVRSNYDGHLRRLDIYWSLLQEAYNTVVFIHVKDQP